MLHAYRQMISKFDMFRDFRDNLDEEHFSEFDSHACSLLGTPMLNAQDIYFYFFN